MTYRTFATKPKKVMAVQWFPNTEHPSVRTSTNMLMKDQVCEKCGAKYGEHGSIDQHGVLFLICHGMWVTTEDNNLFVLYTDTEFKYLFEEVK